MRAELVQFVKPRWRLAVAIPLFLALVAMTDYEPPLPSAPSAAPIVSPIPDIDATAWQGRGRIVRWAPLNDPPLEDRDGVLGQAWRAVYSSVSGIDGHVREVSGAFFVPHGRPPQHGWQVISLAHGTTGIGHNCGPAEQPDLQGYAPVVATLLAAGYAVALTDYEGLGADGTHPYLEPRSAAFNTIDAVRALRALTPAVSSRWVALGYSQGGQAVWAANELNSFYGNGLALQGSVALAPAANLTGVVDLAWSRSLTSDQRALLPLLIAGMGRYTPELNEHSLLRGAAAVGRQSRCELRNPSATATSGPQSPPAPALWQNTVDRVSESNAVRPVTSGDAAALRDALRKVALPQRPLGVPMLVVTGLRDSVVLSGWVQSAVSGSCALGGRIDYQALPDADHRSVLWRSSDTVMQWIADRFAGMGAPSNCAAQPK